MIVFLFHSCRAFTVPYYIGMVVPFLIIYLFNWVVFFIIIVSLIRKHFKSNSNKHSKSSFLYQQLIIVITLSVLFGLGWGIGLFATQDIHSNKTVQDILAALFVVFTAFHGLFIFIMQCLRSKEVRTTWRRLCFVVTRKDVSEVTSSNVLNKRQTGQQHTSYTGTTNVIANDYATIKTHATIRDNVIREHNGPSDTLRSTAFESINEVKEEDVEFAETPFTKVFHDDIREEENAQEKVADIIYANYYDDLSYVETASVFIQD